MLVTFADGSRETYDDIPFKQGSEGKIYLSQDQKSVVKLYHQHTDLQKEVKRKDRIEKLIHQFNPTKDDPYWKQFFTWPEKRVERPSVGFKMPFASGLKTIEHYLFPKAYEHLKPEEKGWFIGQIACAIKLTSAANRMARMGFCYTDFSEKNVMVDPFAGRTVLIDCDSLTIPGKLAPTVEGTSWYRAPEIVSGQVKTPSVETDRHALAVLLYLYLLRAHPLVGNKVFALNNVERDEQLCFGQNALYIEDPTDQSNRHSQQSLKAAMLGAEMERLFKMAFVQGLHSPSDRPLPGQWLEALHHMYDHLIPCASSKCSWHFFVAFPSGKLICPMCHQPIQELQQIPFIYLFDVKRANGIQNFSAVRRNAQHYIIGWPGRNLQQWHCRSDVTPIYSGPHHTPDYSARASLEYDSALKQWYLKNLRLPELRYRHVGDPPDAWRSCLIHEIFPLTQRTQIQFSDHISSYRAHVEMVPVN